MHSQKRLNLEKLRREKLNEIEKVENFLNKTNSDKEVTSNRISLLSKKISLRLELIEDLSSEIDDIEGRIVVLNEDIGSKNSDIIKLKDEYSKMVYSSYYHFRNYNTLIFILASNSFNQAYRRFNFLKQYTFHRKSVLADINNEIGNLEVKISDLQLEKDKKLKLIAEREKENQTLEKDKLDQSALIKKYVQKEKILKKELKELQEATAQIENEIERIIKEEATARLKRSRKSVNADIQLSRNFTENKGKFPWPVENGTITSYFGEHAHPLYKGITIKNNGIDISTDCDSYIRNIFSGTVSKIFAIKGANFAVIIRHGDYLTVYQNIQQISVKIGEKIDTNQAIGTSLCINDAKVTTVHFEIWHELTKLNPVEWLHK